MARLTDEDITWCIKQLEEATAEDFFGTVSFGFRAGVMYTMGLNKTKRPPSQSHTKQGD